MIFAPRLNRFPEYCYASEVATPADNQRRSKMTEGLSCLLQGGSWFQQPRFCQVQNSRNDCGQGLHTQSSGHYARALAQPVLWRGPHRFPTFWRARGGARSSAHTAGRFVVCTYARILHKTIGSGSPQELLVGRFAFTYGRADRRAGTHQPRR